MQCTVLGSGSSANSYLFQTDTCTFVVDNGFSLKEFTARAGRAGCDYRDIDFILVTHGHGDHVKGVGRLSQAARAPVYAAPEVKLDVSGGRPVFKRRDIHGGERLRIGAVEIRSFPLNHDSPGAQSFHVRTGDTSATIITDTGTVSAEMLALAQDTQILFLESNYCNLMLESGPYPPFLKRRIRSERGHLSNDAAIEFLNGLGLSPALEKVFFCHLSDVNNDPEVLSAAVHRDLSWQADWSICRKNEFVPVRA